MRVLVVEDEPTLAESLVYALSSSKGKMIPTAVGNGIHALNLVEQARRNGRPFDALILDLSLPGMDGMDVLRAMRGAGDMTPVLVLTARATLVDRVEGLETGADDYLPKPFEVDEVLARLRAIGRRGRSDAPRQNSSTVGNLTHDAAKGVFAVGGAVLNLPRMQHVILEALFRRRGSLVTTEFLTNLDYEGATHGALHTQISRLRRRLLAAAASADIKTMPGLGYMLDTMANASSAPSGSPVQPERE